MKIKQWLNKDFRFYVGFDAFWIIFVNPIQNHSHGFMAIETHKFNRTLTIW